MNLMNYLASSGVTLGVGGSGLMPFSNYITWVIFLYRIFLYQVSTSNTMVFTYTTPHALICCKFIYAVNLSILQFSLLEIWFEMAMFCLPLRWVTIEGQSCECFQLQKLIANERSRQ